MRTLAGPYTSFENGKAERDFEANWVIDIGYNPPYRIWDGPGEVEIPGLEGTFQPSEVIGEMPATEAGVRGGEGVEMALRLAIADPDVISIFENGGHGRIPVRVWRVFKSRDSGQYVASPHNPNSPAMRYFRGALDTVNMRWRVQDDGVTNLEMVVACEHRFFGDRGIRHRGAQFTEFTQKRIDALDTAWRFLVFLARSTVLGRWGPPPIQPRVRRSSKFGGLISLVITFGLTIATGGTAGLALFTTFLSFMQLQTQRAAAKRAQNAARAIDVRREIISNEAVPIRRFVFGRCLIGGDQLYLGLAADEIYLHMGVMLADHSIEAVDELWLGNGRYNYDTMAVVDIPEGEQDYSTGGRASGSPLVVTTKRLDGISDMVLQGSVLGPERTVTYTVTEGQGDSRETVVRTRTVRDTINTGFKPGKEGNRWEPSSVTDSDGNTYHDNATGTATVFLQLEHKQDKLLPWQQIRFLVRGNDNILMPGDAVGATPTFDYSDNPALVIASYLNMVGGMPYIDTAADGTETVHTGAITAAEAAGQLGGIDMASLRRAAQICEDNGWRIAGAVDFDEDAPKMVMKLAETMGGYVFFDRWNWRMKAAEASPIVATITNDHIKDGKTQAHQNLHNLFNSFGGTMRNDPDNGRYGDTDIPEFEDADALAEDVTPARMDLDFPFIPDTAQALQIGSISLARNRRGGEIVLEMPGLFPWGLYQGDRVTLDITEPIRRSGTWMVTNIAMNGQANMHEVSLVPDDDEIYQYDQTEIDGYVANVADPTPPNSGAGALVLDPPTSVTITADAQEATVAQDGTTQIAVDATVAGADVDYEVEYRVVETLAAEGVSSTYHRNLQATSTTISDDGNAWSRLGQYPSGKVLNIEARFSHPAGLFSAWEAAPAFTVPQDDVAPASPASVVVTGITFETVRIEVAGVEDRDLGHFEVRYTVAQLGGTPALITTEAEWDAAEELERKSSTPVRPGEVWRASYALLGSGEFRIYVRSVDRTGNISEISEDASAIFRFVDNSGIVAQQRYGEGHGWEGVTLERYIEQAGGMLVPFSGKTGAQIDARSDSTAVWNSENTAGESRWFLAPEQVNNQGIVTMPEVVLPHNIDGTLQVSFDTFYPGDPGIDPDLHVYAFFRQHHNGSWGPWTDAQALHAICADKVQMRIQHDPGIGIGFGIRSFYAVVSTSTTETAPALVQVPSTGYDLDYSAIGYVQKPIINAVLQSLDNTNHNTDDYEPVISNITTTEAHIKIQSKYSRSYVAGSVSVETRGFA